MHTIDLDPETGVIPSDFAIPDAKNSTENTESPHHQTPPPQDTTIDRPNPLINQLPTEILFRIFEFAHYLWRVTSTKKETADSPAVWDRSIQHLMRLGQPEILSQVCSLWREIIHSSPALWSQLEIYTLGRSPQTFLDRCSTFLPWTQDHELELFVRFRHCDYDPLSDGAPMKAFCTSISPRLRALTIDNFAPNDATFASSIIQAILPHATPGTLTELFIKDYCARTMFNQLEDNSDGLVGWELPTAELFGITQDLLDSIVAPITSLQLRGQFFPWTSPAYHGLTELTLLCTRPKRGHRPFIKLPQLRGILLACPKLRIFHININITDGIAAQAFPPVPLGDLVELNIRGLSRNLYGVLLPLLAPGQKPLQLTFQTQAGANAPLYCPSILSFFQRTNVASLYILNRSSLEQCLAVEQLLTESPTNLHTLGLERIKLTNLDSSQLDHIKTPSPSHLARLCLRKCIVDVDVLKNVAHMLSVQILKVHQRELQGAFNEGEAQIRQEIISMFPYVKWVRSTRDMDLWNAWEVEYIDQFK